MNHSLVFCLFFFFIAFTSYAQQTTGESNANSIIMQTNPSKGLNLDSNGLLAKEADFYIYDLVNTPLPDFVLEKLDGKKISSADYKGKVVFINFFFLACPPCLQEIPMLNKLYQTYKNSQFEMIGISTMDTPASLEKNLGKTFSKGTKQFTISPMEYPFAPVPSHEVKGSEEIVRYGYNEKLLNNQFKNSTVPASLIIDKKGIIRFVSVGYLPRLNDNYYKVYTREIEKLLAE